MTQRIIIQCRNAPRSNRVKDDLKWICESLGFMSGRDTEDTSFKIMMQLLEEFKKSDIVATERISKNLNIEAPTINHHLRNLIDTGVIVREKRKVMLRGGNLSSAIEEMKKDSDRMFDRILEISKKIDKELGL